jgi:hypothetical protein
MCTIPWDFAWEANRGRSLGGESIVVIELRSCNLPNRGHRFPMKTAPSFVKPAEDYATVCWQGPPKT